MNEISQQLFTEERALFGARGLKLTDCIFERGESPLKECRDLALERSMFRWKYPLWYGKDITLERCVWADTARAGVWYSQNVAVRSSMIQAPKTFRRCAGLALRDVTLTHAAETLWHCSGVTLDRVTAAGDYFGMNCADLQADQLRLDGNYAFDGLRNAEVRDSTLLSKDAFWNSKNVTVYNSFITGEYLGWNSENLTLIDCTIESLQGLCYIQNLTLKNCRLINTTLAFEYAAVEADITSKVESVLNPASGTIRAESIGELILERDYCDPQKLKIICSDVQSTPEHPVW